MIKTTLISLLLVFTLAVAGCDKATYPKEKLAESVKELCKSEFNVAIDVKFVGNTLAIHLPVTNLFDLTLSISKNAQDKIQDVLLGASRVALSTDADLKFYCVIAQDERLPEIQLIIIKYVDDVKRAYLQDISRGEYFKRTIIDINENPQAKKEQEIIKVFDKMKLNKEWQDRVLDDFFRSEPNSLKGIGYWQDKFYVKNITIEEFLAEQIAARIKIRFREKEELQKYAIKSVTGKFKKEENQKIFAITFKSESLLFVVDLETRYGLEKEIFENIYEVASNVIYGYKFRDFNFISIEEENFKDTLITPQEDVYLFKQKKLGINNILNAITWG